MTGSLLIFGLGYSAGHIADLAHSHGWQVEATGRKGNLRFDDSNAVHNAIANASHILSSVPPDASSGTDPVLQHYRSALLDRGGGKRRVLIYLSSTGVYGDTGGAWVDESAPTGSGRRKARSKCDGEWLEHGAYVLRLPGIYGPGRNVLERVAAGKASRIASKDQVFSRIHVADIAAAVLALIQRTSGDGREAWEAALANGGNPEGGGNPGSNRAFNIADDLPAAQNRVVEEACRLLEVEPPPLQSLEQAGLSDAARGFYAENRRVANGKAKRMLGWQLQYPTYREGLRACKAISNPTKDNNAPVMVSPVQR